MLDSLYDCKILKGCISKKYYECTYCDNNKFSESITLNVTPSKVKKLRCPNCGKEVFYLAPYRIHQDIVKDIESKDGILSSAICYFLEILKIPFRQNAVWGKDVETDIEILNKQGKITDLIEIKTFRTNKGEDVLISNSCEGFRKFITAYDKLILLNPNFKLVKYHYITNLDNIAINNHLRLEFKSVLSIP